LQEVAAAATLIAAFVIAGQEKWVFAKTLPVTRRGNPSFTQQIFSDRATIGFVRFAIVLLALYVIASVPALLVGGRWLRGLSRPSVAAGDAVADGAIVIADLKSKLKTVQAERDLAKALAKAALEA
jgi:hypothetical protein